MDEIELEDSIAQDKKEIRLMYNSVVYGSFFMLFITLVISIIRGL